MAPWLTMAEVAARYNRDERTIRRWIRDGHLEARKHKVLGRVYISQEACEKFEQNLGDRPVGKRPQAHVDARELEDVDHEDLGDDVLQSPPPAAAAAPPAPTPAPSATPPAPKRSDVDRDLWG